MRVTSYRAAGYAAAVLAIALAALLPWTSGASWRQGGLIWWALAIFVVAAVIAGEDSAHTAGDVPERHRSENEIRSLVRLQAGLLELGQKALRWDRSINILDDAAALIARTLQVEYCSVLELLSDRKTLLLRAGAGWKEGFTGREIMDVGADSQAGYALCCGGAVVTEDLRTEKRFRGSSLLQQHGVASGMTVIIDTSEGPYGVLGAHSCRPRFFTQDEVDFIQAVANVLGMMIEHRRAEESLLESEAMLNRAQEIAHLGSWHLDLRRNRLNWSDEVFRMFGVPPGSPLTYEAFLAMVHPEDLDHVKQAWSAALKGAPYDIEHRIIVRGQLRWVRERAKVEFDGKGNAIEGIGTVHDITERKLAEEELQRSADEIRDLYNNAPCGYHSLDKDGVVVRMNDTELSWLGYSRDEVVGKMKYRQLLTPQSFRIFEQSYPRFMSAGVIRDLEFRMVRKDGTTLPVLISATAIHDARGNYVMSRSTVYDNTARKRVEREIRRISRANRTLSLCNEAMIRATEEAGLLQQVCKLIVEQAGYRLCWVGRAENDEAKSVRPIAHAGVEEGYLGRLEVTWEDRERGRGPTGTCIRTGRTALIRNVTTDPAMAPWRAEALKRGYASIIAIPLIVRSKPFGALTIYSSDPDAFSPEEVTLLTELANDLAFGLASLRTRIEHQRAEAEIRKLNAELEQRVITRTAELQAANSELERAREREAEVGFKIQQTLLLDQPPADVSGLRVAALTIPSQRIDGDFYNFIRHQDECLDVIVGDVMGKGIPAALVAAATKSHLLKAISHLMASCKYGRLPEPKQIVTLAHAQVARQLIDLESFVTLCYARFDLKRGRMDLVDCGHTGTILRHGRTGACEALHGGNLPLGVREDEIFEQFSMPFETGDLFLFYSDGITETRNRAGELFGSIRLEECIRLNGHLSPEKLVDAIHETVMAFSGSGRLTDDLTSVVVEIEPRQPPLAFAEIELRSELTQLRRAREFVRTFFGGVPHIRISRERISNLELAVNEVVCNIMKHAYHGRTDRWIHMEGEALPDRVSIRLHHLGDPFDPSAVSPPVLDGSRESGFGTYIISETVDQVHYYRDDSGRNCIDLITIIKPE
jgi:PAS domain S-box-containing protein